MHPISNSGRYRRIALVAVLVLGASLAVTGALTQVSAANAKRAQPATPAPGSAPARPSAGVPPRDMPLAAASPAALLRGFPPIVVPSLGASVNATDPWPVIQQTTYTVTSKGNRVLFTVSHYREIPVGERRDAQGELDRARRVDDAANGREVARWLALASAASQSGSSLATNLAVALRERAETLARDAGSATHPLVCAGAGGPTGCPETNAVVAAARRS